MSYGPWGPPWGGYPPPPPGYIPIPSGMDPEKALEFYEKMEKKFADKKKAEEDKKKEGDKKKDAPPLKQPTFTSLQVLLMLMAFGLPVGGMNLLLMNAVLNMLKEHLLK